MIGTMIVLNLFIGVIMTSMDEARAEAALLDTGNSSSNGSPRPDDQAEVKELLSKLDEMSQTIEALKSKVASPSL